MSLFITKRQIQLMVSLIYYKDKITKKKTTTTKKEMQKKKNKEKRNGKIHLNHVNKNI